RLVQRHRQMRNEDCTYCFAKLNRTNKSRKTEVKPSNLGTNVACPVCHPKRNNCRAGASPANPSLRATIQSGALHQSHAVGDKPRTNAAPTCRCNDRMALCRAAAPQ